MGPGGGGDILGDECLREEKERKEPEKTSEFFPKHDYRLLLIRFFRCVFLLIVTSGLRRETRDTIRLQRLLRKL